jgi:hypothetical protein
MAMMVMMLMIMMCTLDGMLAHFVQFFGNLSA